MWDLMDYPKREEILRLRNAAVPVYRRGTRHLGLSKEARMIRIIARCAESVGRLEAKARRYREMAYLPGALDYEERALDRRQRVTFWIADLQDMIA